MLGDTDRVLLCNLFPRAPINEQISARDLIHSLCAHFVFCNSSFRGDVECCRCLGAKSLPVLLTHKVWSGVFRQSLSRFILTTAKIAKDSGTRQILVILFPKFGLTTERVLQTAHTL